MTNQPRTIAYCLAKEIDNNDLSAITGGAEQQLAKMTFKMTLKASTPDLVID